MTKILRDPDIEDDAIHFSIVSHICTTLDNIFGPDKAQIYHLYHSKDATDYRVNIEIDKSVTGHKRLDMRVYHNKISFLYGGVERKTKEYHYADPNYFEQVELFFRSISSSLGSCL